VSTTHAAETETPSRHLGPILRLEGVRKSFGDNLVLDGNELGMVPVVLREAPLGTYLGWNVTAEGFHAGKICNYAGGMIPFAKTKAEREANHDPRPSLEERYGSHEGYVAKVKEAAAKIVGQGFLLQRDADRLVSEAEKSNVLIDRAASR